MAQSSGHGTASGKVIAGDAHRNDSGIAQTGLEHLEQHMSSLQLNHTNDTKPENSIREDTLPSSHIIVAKEDDGSTLSPLNAEATDDFDTGSESEQSVNHEYNYEYSSEQEEEDEDIDDDEEEEEQEEDDEDEEGEDSSEESTERTQEPFIPTQCLFCNANAPSFEDNLHHMLKTHGLFIPYEDDLIVDLETLIGYLHTVITDLTECILCGTIRSNPKAVQQHMLGKGHCRILVERDSELAEFYDLSNIPTQAASTAMLALETRDPTPFRKGNNRASSSRPTKSSQLVLSTTSKQTPESGAGSPTSKTTKNESLTRQAKMNNKFQQLVLRARPSDRQSLMGLTVPQQRALLASEKRAAREKTVLRNRIQARIDKAQMRWSKN